MKGGYLDNSRSRVGAAPFEPDAGWWMVVDSEEDEVEVEMDPASAWRSLTHPSWAAWPNF